MTVYKQKRIEAYNLNPKRCKHCNEAFDYDNKRKLFCNTSCAATYNNQRRKLSQETKDKIASSLRKTPKHTCSECGNVISYKAKTGKCRPCIDSLTREAMKSRTIGEIKTSLEQRGSPSYTAAYIVRSTGRALNKDLTTQSCQSCGYEHHSELCHIKGVSEFKDSATVAEVNDESNILVLCRNCHWEFDHAKLTLDDIPRRK